MNYYVLRPDLTPYEGKVVTKDTKLEFKNEEIKQKLENLVLTTKKKFKQEKYEVNSEMKLYLSEGDILLFEGEGRGWFLPVEPVGTIETAIKDLRTQAVALDGKDYEVVVKE